MAFLLCTFIYISSLFFGNILYLFLKNIICTNCYDRSYGEITRQHVLDSLGKPNKEHHQVYEVQEYTVSTYKAGKYTLEIFFYR
jgi:hypothetical protein